MQDAKQIEQQTRERIAAAETRAAVAQNHSHAVANRRGEVEVAVLKMRLLQEMFNLGRQVLGQRQAGFKTAEQPPSNIEMAAMDDAITEMESVLQQVRMSMARQEGSLQTLQEMETAFKTEADQARGQGRGAEVGGGRAADLAARSGEIVASSAPEPPAEEEDGVGGLLDVLQGHDVADEPISAPQATGTGSPGAPRRKAE